MLSYFNCVQLCATLWTVAHQAPLSMGFSRQEYWSGLPCHPPGDLPNPETEHTFLMSFPGLLSRPCRKRRPSARGRGAAPVRALGAGGCRAPGRGRPATEGPGRARGGEGPALTEPVVPTAGAPGRGLSGCTLHRATPAPSLQHFGVTGTGPSPQQPISGRTGAGARSRKIGRAHV